MRACSYSKKRRTNRNSEKAANNPSMLPHEPTQVPRIAFASARVLAERALPQVLSDSPWPPAAALEWSPSSLDSSVPILERVRVMPRARAIFWNPSSTHALEHNARYGLNTSRTASLDEIDGTAGGAELRMSPTEFFSPSPGNVHYTSLGRLEDIGGQYPELEQAEALSEIAAEPSRPRLSVWMGTAGAVTQLHHDTDNNFYAQLHGDKTFLLYPPSATHEAVYLHPRLHPLSHLPVPHAPSEAEAAAGLVYPPYVSTGVPAAQRVQLRRGDVLFIPAFWGHLATCNRDCISANVWWPSRYKLVERELMGLPLPFEVGEWDAALLKQVGVAYLVHMARNAIGGNTTAVQADAAAASDDDASDEAASAAAAASANAAARDTASAVQQLFDGRWRHQQLLPQQSLLAASRTASAACSHVPSSQPATLQAKVEQYAALRGAILNGVQPAEVRLVLLHEQLEAIAHFVAGWVAQRPSGAPVEEHGGGGHAEEALSILIAVHACLVRESGGEECSS